MIAVKTIVEGIAGMLQARYPSCTFHVQKLPATVTGPSFFVYLDTDRSEDNSRTETIEATSVGIVYYPPAQEPAAEELSMLSVYSTVKDMFRKGYVQIGGRALKVALIRGGRKNSETYLVVKLVYSDDRPYSGDTYQMMGEVKLK